MFIDPEDLADLLVQTPHIKWPVLLASYFKREKELIDIREISLKLSMKIIQTDRP